MFGSPPHVSRRRAIGLLPAGCLLSTGRGVPVLACRAGHGGGRVRRDGVRRAGELRGVLLDVWLGRVARLSRGVPSWPNLGPWSRVNAPGAVGRDVCE